MKLRTGKIVENKANNTNTSIRNAISEPDFLKAINNEKEQESELEKTVINDNTDDEESTYKASDHLADCTN